MRRLYKIFSSLRLTLVLLGFAMALVFFGTLEQVELGIRAVQERYFESWFVVWSYPQAWPGGGVLPWLRLALPGGYLLGGLLLVNLACAQSRYFRMGWMYTGLALIHSGLLLLLIAGFGVSLFQEETQLFLEEGQAKNYSEDLYKAELALVDTTDPAQHRVAVVPFDALKPDEVYRPEGLLTMRVRDLKPNARVLPVVPNGPKPYEAADRGHAKDYPIAVQPYPLDYKDEQNNQPALLLSLYDAQETYLGTWFLSTALARSFPPQTLEHEGRTYTLALRARRAYTPYWMHLKRFTHERYPGTGVPKSFTSDVELLHPPDWRSDPARIEMNLPLRTHGQTYYQASFSGETQSILQVVRNPSWRLPYISLAFIALGLFLHFGLSLWRYRRSA